VAIVRSAIEALTASEPAVGVKLHLSRASTAPWGVVRNYCDRTTVNETAIAAAPFSVVTRPAGCCGMLSSWLVICLLLVHVRIRLLDLCLMLCLPVLCCATLALINRMPWSSRCTSWSHRSLRKPVRLLQQREAQHHPHQVSTIC
jgi:hypothetical protein